MDGNGRWANRRHLPRVAGHKAGVNATRKIVENCARKNIEVLTIFAFSSENWRRPPTEVGVLMELFMLALLGMSWNRVLHQVELMHPVPGRMHCLGGEPGQPVVVVDYAHTPDALEQVLDRLTAEVGPLENFILPGGTSGAATLHVARTVCRRAERSLVALAEQEPVGPHTIRYLNRLSDALFVMARFENKRRGVPDVCWDRRLMSPAVRSRRSSKPKGCSLAFRRRARRSSRWSRRPGGSSTSAAGRGPTAWA